MMHHSCHSCQQAPTTARASNRIPGHPSWLRHRSLGKLPNGGQHMSWSTEMIERLGQEACLKGHRSCVNCLEWNSKGDLLASGSDDGNVIIWDAFRRKRQHVIQTGHDGPVFSVKFMPNTNDIDLATCALNKIRVIDSLQHKTLLNCNQCHTGRVKRLAVHRGEPNLIWSAAEDGQILEYDVRLNHVCNTSRPSNILVDFRTISHKSRAKCIAVNPTRSEMLAVGADDACTRLFDRRYIKLTDLNSNKKSNSPCMTHFAPGHLLTAPRCNYIQTHGVTYLTFNSRGTELLASYHGEQVYLFDICKPRDRYISFEHNIKPLLLGGFQRPRPVRSKPNCTKRMRHLEPDVPRVQSQREMLLDKIRQCNEDISGSDASPKTYCVRSRSLLERDWRGDKYQALRDLCDALAVNPLNVSAMYHLAQLFRDEDDLESANALTEFISLHHYDMMSQFEMKMILGLLTSYQRDAALNRKTTSPFNIGQTDPLAIERLLRGPNDPYYINPLERRQKKSSIFDYTQRYCGHCNMSTDIKEANFLGPNDEYIVSGSDDGAFYIWNKKTANIVKAVDADNYNLNCVQPHPNIPMLATSGVESSVKLWSPIGPICNDVVTLAQRFYQNQEFIKTDPLDLMIRELNQGRVPNHIDPRLLRYGEHMDDEEMDRDSW